MTQQSETVVVSVALPRAIYDSLVGYTKVHNRSLSQMAAIGFRLYLQEHGGAVLLPLDLVMAMTNCVDRLVVIDNIDQAEQARHIRERVNEFLLAGESHD